METKAEDEKVRVETKTEALLEHLHRRLPEFTATGPLERLGIGHFSHAYRVRGEPTALVVKVPAPPAASPGSIERHSLVIEARTLAAFEPHGDLERAVTATVRPPRILDFDRTRHILVMEDVGDVPHLGDWLAEGGAERETSVLRQPGNLLGCFVAALHWESFAKPRLAVDLDSSAIQGPRLELRYGAVGDLLRKAGVPDADELGRKAAEMGQQLQTPGVCVVHGDLWPPAILMTDGGLGVIDWELAHYGHPAQDVGHLASHLWMHAHRASTREAAIRARAALEDFLATYRAGLGSAFDEVFGARGVRQSSVHFGAEVLMRAMGVLQTAYLYAGLGVDVPVVQQAVEVAARHIRSPERADTFAPLLA
jgi:hypothetical protein